MILFSIDHRQLIICYGHYTRIKEGCGGEFSYS